MSEEVCKSFRIETVSVVFEQVVEEYRSYHERSCSVKHVLSVIYFNVNKIDVVAY